jgi:hypothetical protein
MKCEEVGGSENHSSKTAWTHAQKKKKGKMFTISRAVVGPTGTRTQSVFAYNAYVCVCVLKSKAFRRNILQGTCSKNSNRKACLLLM